VAFACLGVRTVTEGRRQLELSPPLRRWCGIDSRIPSKHAFYRFERRLAAKLRFGQGLRRQRNSPFHFFT